MAGKDDRYAERLREKARRFDERGRKGTLAQEQVAELDRQKVKLPSQPKKDNVVEEDKNDGK